MEIKDITYDERFLKETFILCMKEWGSPRNEEEYLEKAISKTNDVLNKVNDKIIKVLGLIEDDTLLGFISLYKYDGDERHDLTPWYATMYVKSEYRGLGYSKVLNDAILNVARELGYNKIYLKSDLKNYYEKFGAIKFDKLSNGEDLFYMDL